MKTALLIGATGLVGRQLLKQLLSDARFSKVISFGRRASGEVHPKLDERIVDFEASASWAEFIRGDVAFSALGTTIGQAGSQAAQRKVDYQYQFDFARAAAKNGVGTYVLCSASSANPTSLMFYSRLKGELDRDVQQLGFERVRIMRPSLLGGNRDAARAGEKWGGVVLGALNSLGVARRYREIPGEVVARAMINSAFEETRGTRIFTLDEVFAEAERPTA